MARLVGLLARFPELGQPAPKTGKADARRLIVNNYAIYYRLRKGGVEVAAVEPAGDHVRL